VRILRGEALVALLGVWLLWTGVFDVQPVRVNLARGVAATSGRVTLPLPVGRVPAARLVTVLRVTNRSAAPVHVTAAVDGVEIARATIKPGALDRIDAEWPRPVEASSESTLQLTGDQADWNVDAELANVFGSSRGLLNLVVVPTGQSVPGPSPWAALVFVALAVLAWPRRASGLPAAPGARGPRPCAWRTWTWRLAAVLFVAVFVLTAAAPLVSRYRVGLSSRTFVLGLLVLLGPAAWLRARQSSVAPRVRDWAARPLVAVALMSLVAVSAYTSAAAFTVGTFGGNVTGALHMARAIVDRAPFLQERPDLTQDLIVNDDGYDGQFMFLLAFDPFLQRFADTPARYREFVDLPPYRYGRIGFPVLTRAVSGGRPELFACVMLGLIVVAHLGLAAMFGLLAAQHGLSPWTGLVYLAIPGFASSLTFALPESLAALGLVTGVYGWTAGRPWLAALGFGASLLVRETGAVLVVSLAAVSLANFRSSASRPEWRRSIAALALALVPLALWRVYVGVRLFPDFGWSALQPSPGIIGAPFAGIVAVWAAAMTGTHAASERTAAMAYPLLLIAGLAIALVALKRRRDGIALAACAYGALAMLLNYSAGWSHVPSTERTTYELPLCLALVWCTTRASVAQHAAGDAVADARRWRLVLGAFFAALATYTLFASPEAFVARAALLLIR
jgi:hypothetical protein